MNRNNQLLLLSLLIILLLFSGNLKVSAEEINIETTANGFLFNTENLKPGDWVPRKITISNAGRQDFKYTAKIGKSASKKGLLAELELLVQKGDQTLYTGKLKDFKEFTPRELASGSSETLLFQVTMPAQLGNEFQGSFAEAELIFFAETIGAATNPVGDNRDGAIQADQQVTPKIVGNLPDTATNLHNYVFIGIFLLVLGSVLLVLRRKNN